MKKYRTKIDTPWLKKGEVFISRGKNPCIWVIESTGAEYFNGDPADYPDFFEEIPERSDVEKLAEWLHIAHYIGRYSELLFYQYQWENLNIEAKDVQRRIAQKIIDAGVDVSKLIGGME